MATIGTNSLPLTVVRDTWGYQKYSALLFLKFFLGREDFSALEGGIDKPPLRDLSVYKRPNLA